MQPPYFKDPADTSLLSLDFSDWLAEIGADALDDAEWTAYAVDEDGIRSETDDVTLAGAGLDEDALVASVRASGGTLGLRYYVTCQATAGNFTQSESIPLHIVAR